ALSDSGTTVATMEKSFVGFWRVTQDSTFVKYDSVPLPLRSRFSPRFIANGTRLVFEAGGTREAGYPRPYVMRLRADPLVRLRSGNVGQNCSTAWRPGEPVSVALSGDARSIAIRQIDCIVVRDLETDREIRTLDVHDRVPAVAYGRTAFGTF